MNISQGSREHGKYYPGSFTNKNLLPIEIVKLECCGKIEEIPIAKEDEYLCGALFDKRCPNCNDPIPITEWMSMPKDIEYICYI